MYGLHEKYNEALELFEQGKYFDAVSIFIDLYNSDFLKNDILQFLSDCFISPNEEEFKNTFYQNNIYDADISYSDVKLDFIPVEENVYFIFDREKQQFDGYIDLENLKANLLCCDIEIFDDICMIEEGDLRVITQEMGRRKFDKKYVVVEEEKYIFLSFCKIPGIKEGILDVFDIFTRTKDFVEYLTSNVDVMLPKIFAGDMKGELIDALKTIHCNRIYSAQCETTPFLSICIPSYNRGSILKYNVEQLLKMEYDIEVEIVVSNNCSDRDVEGYQEIKNLKDNRIVYHEFTYMADISEGKKSFFRNVHKTFSLARGKWVVFCSDEDVLRIDELPSFLDFLKANNNIGALGSSGIGDGFRKEKTKFFGLNDSSRFTQMLDYTYLTGLTLQRSVVEKGKAFERLKENRGNVFVEFYPHCLLGAYAAEYYETGFYGGILWDAKLIENMGMMDPERIELDENNNPIVKEYATYESRTCQLQDSVSVLCSTLKVSKGDLKEIIVQRMLKAFHLLGVAYHVYTRQMSLKSTWVTTCCKLYIFCSKLIAQFGSKFDNKIIIEMNLILDKVFLLFYNYDNIVKDFDVQIMEKQIEESRQLQEYMKKKNTINEAVMEWLSKKR